MSDVLCRSFFRMAMPLIALIILARALGGSLPDAGQLAFHSTSQRVQDIYLLDLRSAKLHNLTETRMRDERSPAWSPDGSALIYVARGRENRSDELFLYGLKGADIRQLTPDGSNGYMPSWSPDGRSIAFVVAFNRVTVLNLDAPERHQTLTRGYNPHWSPASDQIAFTGTDITGSAFIGAIAPDGSGSQFLTVGGSNFMDASWSPDGSHMVAVGSRNRALDLFLLDARCLPRCQSEARRLTTNAGNDHAPDWSPDGRQIAYTCAEAEGVSTHICLLNLSDGSIRVLSSDLTDAINDSPAWRP